MSKKAKIILICLAVAIVVVASVLIPVLIIKLNSNPRLQTPQNVEVIDSENLIVLKTNENENAIKYVFEIFTPNGNKYEIPSETCELVLDLKVQEYFKNKIFNVGGVFSVQVYAVAEEQKNNSYKSNPTNFVRTFTLQTPTIYKNNNTIVWEKIANALEYEIVVSSATSENIKILSPSTDQTLSQESLNFKDLISEFNLQSGIYYVAIRAKNENQYYVNSTYSNDLEFEVK